MYVTSSARDFVMILANETGNALDSDLLGKGDFEYTWSSKDVKITDNEIRGTYINIYGEAAKMAYQGAFTRLLEDIGVDLSVADTQSNRENINKGEKLMEQYFKNLSIDQTGWYLLWAKMMETPELKSEIEQNHKLSSASSMKLHDIILKDLVTHSDFIERAQAKLGNQSLGQEIVSYIYKQLTPNGKITDMLPGQVYRFFTP